MSRPASLPCKAEPVHGETEKDIYLLGKLIAKREGRGRGSRDMHGQLFLLNSPQSGEGPQDNAKRAPSTEKESKGVRKKWIPNTLPTLVYFRGWQTIAPGPNVTYCLFM